MSNADTIKSLTDNVQTVLQDSLGIKFERQNLEDIKDIAASKFPFGGFFDVGTEFDETHGERASYGVQSYLIWVVFKERDNAGRMRKSQEWRQLIRSGLTTNALNIGDLSASKLVSWVDTTETDIDQRDDGLSVLNYTVGIRYREL